jgi:hypothetical protein
MRKLLPLLAIAVLFTGISLVAAADKKDVTLTGEALCAKCALKEEKTCQSVVIVKEDGKEVKYYLERNDVAKKTHGALGICPATKEATIKVKVMGDVVEKDGKKILTATKVEKAD